MRLLAAVRATQALATPEIKRRGAILAAWSLVDRGLLALTAWMFLERSVKEKIALAVVLGGAVTARDFVVRVFSARTEADLFDRVIASLLDGDVLRPSVLPDEDAGAELGQAVYHAASALSVAWPTLVGDAVASVLLTIVLCWAEPLRLVGVAVGLMLVAAIALAWSRGRVQRAADAAWMLQERVFQRFVDALEGRLEIVASGHRAEFVAASRARSRAWGAAGARVAGEAIFSGRVPLLAIALAVALIVAADSHTAESFSVRLSDLALLASVTPAFGGVAQGLLALARGQHWIRLVAQTTAATPRAPNGTFRPQGSPIERAARQGSPIDKAARQGSPIAFEQVCFHYEGRAAPALSGVTFASRGARIVALAGSNGSGKSTCLRLLLALAPPASGKITVGGLDLATLDADTWRAGAAFLPQRPYLPPRADVRTAVRLVAPRASDERILRALERVGLLPSLRRATGDPLALRVGALSVGERQRVALARVLCRDASLFVLDEPDANLDKDGIAMVADVVRELAETERTLVVFAAHAPELLALAGVTVVLARGRVESGALEEVTSPPKKETDDPRVDARVM